MTVCLVERRGRVAVWANRYKAEQSRAKQSNAEQIKAEQSKAKQCKERQGKAKQSKAKQSKAKLLASHTSMANHIAKPTTMPPPLVFATGLSASNL